MTCRGVRRRLSAFLDGDLDGAESRAVASHLQGCPECARRWRSLRESVRLLAGMPRVEPSEGIGAGVLDRLEVESRGPGLALLFRPVWSARPLMLPSLVPAALVLVTILAAALALDQEPRSFATVAARTRGDAWEARLPPSGTEANPLFPSAGVSVPRVRQRDAFPADLLEAMGEGTLFLETVIARDGSVSAIRLLGGDTRDAGPILDLLRKERFEPGRYRGRPVAVSVYRLFSRMEVRPPLT